MTGVSEEKEEARPGWAATGDFIVRPPAKPELAHRVVILVSANTVGGTPPPVFADTFTA